MVHKLFELYKQMDNRTIRNDARLVFEILQIDSVEDLITHSREEMIELGVPDHTIENIEQILIDSYGYNLNQETYVSHPANVTPNSTDTYDNADDIAPKSSDTDIPTIKKEDSGVVHSTDSSNVDEISDVVLKEKPGTKRPRPTRRYDVRDMGDYVIANGVEIKPSNYRNALSKGEIIDLYTRDSRGEQPKDIANALGRSMATVQKYINKILQEPSEEENNTIGENTKRHGGGAPPISPLAYKDYIRGVGDYAKKA